MREIISINKKALCFLVLFASSLSGFGQISPTFKSLRYDDDFSFLKNDSLVSWYDKIKFIPFNEAKTLYASVGGEARFQYVYIQNEKWGGTKYNGDGYLLSRSLAHFDLHYKNVFRGFLQMQSSLASGRNNPSLVERNPLEFHQAFIDATLFQNKAEQLYIRTGRQEMSFGSQRLISVSEGPNNRRAFDGFRMTMKTPNFKSDAFYTLPVNNQTGFFDDEINNSSMLWGSYTVINKIPVIKNMDIYYFGLSKEKGLFANAKGKELRHTLGLRIWNDKSNWQYDFEGAYQFGRIENEDIAAWFLSASVSYQSHHLIFKPKFGLKTEITSGDSNAHDNKLQTFNSLYPQGTYFGLSSLIGHGNLFDINPSVELELAKRVHLGFDYNIFWRVSRNDGIYASNLQILYPDNGAKSKFVGNQVIANLDFQYSPFLFFRLEGTWNGAGGFLKQAGPGKDINYMRITTTFKF